MACEDFEDPRSAWTVLTESGSTVERSDTFGYRGASLRAEAPPGSTLAARLFSVFPQNPPAEQWVRAYIYIAASSELDVEPIALTNSMQQLKLVFSLYEDATDIHAHSMAGDFNNSNNSRPPRDRWVCYELYVRIGTTGRVALYRDDVLVVEQTAIDTRPPSGGLSHVLVGIASTSQSTTQEIYVDELVADTTRIGCE